MSFSTWHRYGFGFCFTDVLVRMNRIGKDITIDDINRLMTSGFQGNGAAYPKECVENINAVVQDIQNCKDKSEITSDDIDEALIEADYYCGIAELFADVVSTKEDLPNVIACDDYDNNHYVIFHEASPWSYNDKEKDMTVDGVKDIFMKYLRLLNPCIGDEVAVDFGDQEVENGG